MANWRIGDAFYKGFQFHVAIPAKSSGYGVTSQSIKTERRLQISEKPGVDGAEVEDFGRKPQTFNCDVVFFTNDYVEQLEKFESILNQGTSGELILPDMHTAANAKFQSEERRTATDTMTVLSLTFIEDIKAPPTATVASTSVLAKAALSANNPTAAIPAIASLCSTISQGAQSLTNTLNNNPVINAIQAANNSVVGVTSTINSVLNIARTTRQTIISLVKETQNNLKNIQAATQGLLNFTDLLNLTTVGAQSNSVSQPLTTAQSSTLASIDYKNVGTSTTTTVNGSQQVVQGSTIAPTQVNSFKDATTQFQSVLETLQSQKQGLETNTSGNTDDFTVSSVQLEKQIQTLLGIIETPPLSPVYSDITMSLAEICFLNGKTVEDIDTVYQNNNNVLTDILTVPAFTIVYL